MIARSSALLAAAAVLVSTPAAVAEPPAPPSPIVPPPVQPANIGDLKTEATQYYDSGAYLTDLQLAAWPAIPWIDEQAPGSTGPRSSSTSTKPPCPIGKPSRPTISAASSAARATSCRKGRAVGGRGICAAQSTVIAPTMDVFNTAKDRGAAIFFITGRAESQRAATERNLADVGYTGYTRLIMEPVGAHYVSAADFKAPQRQAIEQEGYTIVANMGDQPSDLDGGFAERTFLLPNPFYRIP